MTTNVTTTQLCILPKPYNNNLCICNNIILLKCNATQHRCCHNKLLFISLVEVLGSCKSHGNTYTAISQSGCASYTVSTATNPPIQHSCPGDLLFDTVSCTCNYADKTTCVNTCHARGNKFSIVDGSGCTKYKISSATISPTALSCPDGLVFDADSCTCNFKNAVTCNDDKNVIG